MTGTLAVTGATGFVGRRLVAAALARGWAVRALVRDPSRMAPPVPGLTVARWDITDPPATADGLLAGADVLCHLAAYIPPDMADPSHAEACFRTNTLGTLALLEAASAAGVPRLVHLSTGNAYAPATGPVREDHPLYPSARAPYYLASKLAGEVIADHWGRSGRLATCVLRVASVYGPGMAAGGLVPSLTGKLRAGQPVVLREEGRYGTDLVLVDDVVDAVLAAAHANVAGPINVGSGVRTTAAELARSLLELTHAAPALVTLAPAASGPGDPGFPALDITRARATLNHRPTGLREGLARYVQSLPSEQR